MSNIIDRMRYHADHNALLLTQAELLRWITLLGDLEDSLFEDNETHVVLGTDQFRALFYDYNKPEVDNGQLHIDSLTTIG